MSPRASPRSLRSSPVSRRELLRTGALVGAASLAGCLGLDPTDPPTAWSPAPNSWPLAGYDGRNTRRNPNASPPRDPTIDWRVQDQTAEFETLVVADGGVFVGGTSVRAYETDGSLRWKLNRGAMAMGVVNGTLYVADNPDGVAAVSPDDGTVAWTVEFDHVAYGVLPTTDRVFVASHNRHVCLDAETGDVRWAQWAEGGVGPTGVALGDALYTADVGSVARRSPRGVVARLRGRPPAVDWEATRGLEFPHAPVLGDGMVFVPDESFASERSGGVTAFGAADGSVRWTRELGREAYTPALAGEMLVTGAWDEDGERYELVALDRWNGSVRWRVEPGHWVGSVAVADGVVVAAGGDTDGGVAGAVSAYGLDGSHEWTVETAGDVLTVALVGDRVYVTSRAGEVYALGEA